MDEKKKKIKKPRGVARLIAGKCIACGARCETSCPKDCITMDDNGEPIINTNECIGCGKCAEACKTKSVGVIVPNPETDKPEHFCTLCDGDPQCVKYCPFDALAYVEVDTKRKFYGMSPDTIAKELNKRFYNIQEGR